MRTARFEEKCLGENFCLRLQLIKAESREAENFESFARYVLGNFLHFPPDRIYFSVFLMTAVTDDSKVLLAAVENTRLKASELKKKL
jgi:hypothetical protein